MPLDMWELKHDVVSFGSLRITVQRIAFSYWNSSGTLRSWGLVPLHRQKNILFAPCALAEVLWLGVWLENSHGPARVSLIDTLSGYTGTARLPKDFQIGFLQRRGSPDRPISLNDGLSCNLRVELDCIEMQAVLSLLLIRPLDWSYLSGIEPPKPLDLPPPLPPALG